MRSLVLGLLVLMSAIARADPALPRDVERFVQRRDLCDHFRGEDPYDAQRRAFLHARMRELCTGTDAQLAALRRKYKARPEVMSKLDQYEQTIEHR